MSNRDRWLVSEPDGCHVHPHCLSCPREYCILDEAPERAPRRSPIRFDHQAIIARFTAGESITEIANSLTMHRNTVWNVVKRSTAAKQAAAS